MTELPWRIDPQTTLERARTTIGRVASPASHPRRGLGGVGVGALLREMTPSMRAVLDDYAALKGNESVVPCAYLRSVDGVIVTDLAGDMGGDSSTLAHLTSTSSVIDQDTHNVVAEVVLARRGAATSKDPVR